MQGMRRFFRLIFLMGTYILSKFPIEFLEIMELASARAQGKGFSPPSTTKREVASTKFLVDKFNLDPLLIFDVGANIGDYVSDVLELFPKCHVIAFEPNDFSFNVLNSKFQNHSRVSCENIAFGEQEGSGELFFDTQGSKLSSLIRRDLNFLGIEFDNTQQVAIQTVDQYCRRNSLVPDILKLDIEGAELAVLHGSRDTLKHISVVQFEFGGSNKDSRTFFIDFWNFFRRENFDLFRITPGKPRQVHFYKEVDECFLTTNFLAVNRKSRPVKNFLNNLDI
jgi:FkbM family methyltransferase